ncbi:ATP-binding protein [Streptomyces sp. NPDC005438]|uniref:ATP-binding protein n=1 Tax=Streptomyces sp. NPDC005438 TaxID=3156880 RepID=UPI0033B69097
MGVMTDVESVSNAGFGPVAEDQRAGGDRETTVSELSLDNRPESTRQARRHTHETLRRQWRLPLQLTDNVVLLVSELTGNAVRHTGAHTIGLTLRRRGGWIRVEVRDPSRSLPCRMPVHELDVSGRGLFLVETLSDRWGVDLLPFGKTTWFEVRAQPR